MGTRIRWVLGLTLAAWLLVVAPANAYVDPGTTGYVFSLLVAFFAAAGMTLKLFWRRITGFFSRSDDADDTAGTAAPEAAATDDADQVTERA